MDRIRVMIVDDSVVVRRALSNLLESEPDFEIAAIAANGQIALTRLASLAIDVVLLDVEMPELDGIATLRQLRVRWPELPVVMCSGATERGAAVTIDALAAGATDYVTKPTQKGQTLGTLKEELCRKLRAVVRRKASPVDTTVRPRDTLAPVMARPSPSLLTPSIVAIASSTGGPNALMDVWRGLPRAFPVPIVIVQHMPPVFTRLLAERLTALGGIPVKEGVEGERLMPGEARIAPGGLHMEIVGVAEHAIVDLHEGPQENSCRPAADVLFRSVARVYRARSLAIVLTGMGQDGLAGSRAIVEESGSVVVQDEASSVVWGMPGFVARAGLAREVVPLSEISQAIVRIVRPSQPKSRDDHSRQRLPLRP